MLLEAGVTYWIRWASFDGPCAEAGVGNLALRVRPWGAWIPKPATTIPWRRRTTAHASTRDPACNGPDLVAVEEAIINSLQTQVMQVSESDCYIDEGCLNGYGDRELVRFDTHPKTSVTSIITSGCPARMATNQFEWEIATATGTTMVTPSTICLT